MTIEIGMQALILKIKTMIALINIGKNHVKENCLHTTISVEFYVLK